MSEWKAEVSRRLAGLALPAEREAEIVEELAQHLADLYQARIAAGATPEQARRAVLDQLGEEQVLAKRLRSATRKNVVADARDDIRYALRGWLKNPGFTAVAVIALALGIGANTAVFSVFNGVLLHPLPFPESDRLVWLWPADARTGQAFGGAISPPDFVDYRKQNEAFEHLAAFTPIDLTVTGGGEPERIQCAAVSAGFFETLGVLPVIGRAIQMEDEQTRWPRIAVLSDGLWRRRFAADPNVVGRSMVLDGKSMTIAGVMPAGFAYPKDAQLWQPLPFGFAEMKVRRFHFLHVIGRLKRGVTVEQAEARMKAICANLARIYPNSNSQYSSKVARLLDEMVGDFRPTAMVLMVAVGFVLLIACANVAHLLLARAAARQKEMALRASLGANAGRLVRQLLAESALLAVLGGGGGLLLAVWGVSALKALNPTNLPRLEEVRVDGRVLVFTAALSLATALLFGLLPALRTCRPQLAGLMKEGGQTGSGGRPHRMFHSILVSAEVAFTVVLLVGAGLMLRAFQRLEEVNPGFNPAGVMSLQVSLPRTPVEEMDQAKDARAQTIAFFRPLLERLKAAPGVESVGLISELPLSGQNNDTSFTIEGPPPVKPSERPNADNRSIGGDYFQAMSIPLLRGRYFSDSDNENGANVIIIGQALAERYFPNQNPIGQHLNIDLGITFRGEIVGVVGDVRHRSLARGPYPAVYVPQAQAFMSRANVVIRARTDPMTLAATVTREVHALNRDVPVFGIHVMGDLVSGSIAQPRFRSFLLSVFAAAALILAAAGIYGVMSYSVTLRTHELGIRIALGAGRGELLRMVVGRGMLLALIGVAIGLAGAFGLARLMAGMLYQIPATDPVSFAAVPVVLAVVAFLANYIPARRATKVDATIALRYQ